MEDLLIPYHTQDLDRYRSALVVAPHPDDEVFGCGGTLATLCGVQARNIATLVLTNGAGYGDPDTRRAESARAAQLLGYPLPEFLDWPDRGLRFGEELIDLLVDRLRRYQADVVFAPSFWEVHPDHRAAAASAFEAARRYGKCDVILYEVGAPLRPNLLVDITSSADVKRAAMRCFESQLEIQAYDRQIDALNIYRTYTLGASVERAEAFVRFEARDLADGFLNVFNKVDGEQFSFGQLRERSWHPLVSVLIRSMDRDTLSETLNSVAAQTWPNVEVVVVNAKGACHRPVQNLCGGFDVRFIDSSTPLRRAKAANRLLDAALGEYCVFVDDDDILLPGHLSTLIEKLRHSSAAACYGAIRCEDFSGNFLMRFATPFDRARLHLGNYIPIHAAVFRNGASTKRLRFDENFDICEDWDFWINMAQTGDFIYVDEDVGVYRMHEDQGFGISHSSDALRDSDVPVLRKWLGQWGDEDIYQIATLAKYGAAARGAVAEHGEEGISAEDVGSAIDRWARDSREAAESLAVLRESNPTEWAGAPLLDIVSQLEAVFRPLRGVVIPQASLAARVEAVVDAYRRCAAGEAVSVEWRSRAIEAESALAALRSSRSWRITAPLRQGADGLRRVKGRLERSGPIGAALVRRWNVWRARRSGVDVARRLKISSDASVPSELDFLPVDVPDTVLPSSGIIDRIGVHAHVFYQDLIPEIYSALNNIPRGFDLYVSASAAGVAEAARKQFKKIHRINHLTVIVVPNRGRDLAPFLVNFRKALAGYDLLLHIHSKKSLYSRGAMDRWRGYLFDALLGGNRRIEQIIQSFEREPDLGIVYPQNYQKIPYTANTWLANRHEGKRWCAVLGIPEPEGNYFDFPAGSMFWARPAALKPLFDYEWALEDFPEEAGQNDGTTAHVLERLLVQAGRRSGYRPAILRDLGQPNWSPWRADGYFSRTLDLHKHVPGSAEVRVVMVDIFDTLLTRPLLDAESVKKIVARCAGGAVGARYLEHRSAMEQQARTRLDRDVNLSEIFDEFVHRDVLAADEAAEVRDLEERIELASVAPRQDVVDWVRSVARGGRRVVLVSDMFLPRATIERMLASHGVQGWSDIYLSNEVQARKDAGTMYDLVLRREGVSESDVLMVGDNERSDVQIPGDRGIRVMHVMRSVDQARILPRWRSLLRDECAHPLAGELTLGLILKQFFGRAFPSTVPREEDFTLLGTYGIGYAVVGPMLAAFSAWLHRQARRDGRTRLLFLAREGELLKLAFDRLAGGFAWTVRTDYLELSRRCVTVARIASEADVRKIAASADFFADDLGAFVEARYGLTLTAADLADLERRGIWQRGRAVRFSGAPTHLDGVLADLTPRILAQARREREGLDAYLAAKRIDAAQDVLVDVGYSGTIQDALSALLGQALPGYYMMTRDRIAEVVRRHSSFAKACFGELLTPEDRKPAFWVHPFEVEQLLSSDEAQVLHYVRGDSGTVEQVRQLLSERELAARPSRKELRRGAMDFIDAVIGVHRDLLPDFEVPAECAEGLFKAWADKPSAAEREALHALVLDDYYCGRGVVEPFRGPAQHGDVADAPNVGVAAVTPA